MIDRAAGLTTHGHTIIACSECLMPTPAVWHYVGDRAATMYLCEACHEVWLPVDPDPKSYHGLGQ